MYIYPPAPCKEFAFQGVEMRGPAAGLGRAGAKGKHTNNIRRDWFRRMDRMELEHRES